MTDYNDQATIEILRDLYQISEDEMINDEVLNIIGNTYQGQLVRLELAWNNFKKEIIGALKESWIYQLLCRSVKNFLK